jgi:hypothetical protein
MSRGRGYALAVASAISAWLAATNDGSTRALFIVSAASFAIASIAILTKR